ncbi:MAG: hypothetical protein OXC10_20940 [Rhodospirillaceae bacterium]|nr:hypothetical protein [Rhodospirillaceae bacterium]
MIHPRLREAVARYAARPAYDGKRFFAGLARTRRAWRVTERGELRQVLKIGYASDPPRVHCPITAVAWRETARYYPLNRYGRAAHYMRLSPATAAALSAAADNLPGHRPALRARLLAACGLDAGAAR